MPYIDSEARNRIGLKDALDLGEEYCFDGNFPQNAGELNYVLTMIIRQYIKNRPKVNYELLNEVDGVMGLCQAEFRRRIVYPYEDKKISLNGDVWDDL